MLTLGRDSDYSRSSEEIWLLEKLSGHDIGIEGVSKEQIAVWVFENMENFENKYSEIADFLKTGAKPSDPSLERFAIL